MNPIDTDKITLECAQKLAGDGIEVLRQNSALKQEVVECAKALTADRPPEVLEDENRDELTMLAGVALGIGFAYSQAQIEARGGFDHLIEQAGGEDELVALLKDGDLESVLAKLSPVVNPE